MFKTHLAISQNEIFQTTIPLIPTLSPPPYRQPYQNYSTISKLPNLTKIAQPFPLLSVKTLPKWTNTSILTDKDRDLRYTLIDPIW
jgi:hypothetical protein